MLESRDLYRIDARSDVSYYKSMFAVSVCLLTVLVKWPAPLSDRDFVNQNVWQMFPETNEFIVMNFSVALKVRRLSCKYLFRVYCLYY